MKILVVSASGMGCTVMFTPALQLLRRHLPEARITLLGINPAFVAPVAGSPLVDETVVFDFEKTSLLRVGSLGRRLADVRELRRRRFDASLTVFPSNKWHFNVFAAGVGARRRITHRYATPAWKTARWLQNVTVPADPRLHDVEQNVALLAPLGIVGQAPPPLYFHVPGEAEARAAAWWGEHGAGAGPVIAMHVGSSSDFAFAAKRWPTERFAALADLLAERLGARVLVVAGPQELREVELLRGLTARPPAVVREPLAVVAALLRRCSALVTNDSGVMHIGAAVGTPLVAIFGPTSLSRTRPWSSRATVLHDAAFQGLWRYPFTATSAAIDADAARRSFAGITVDAVFQAVRERLAAADGEGRGQQGPAPAGGR
jgi:ADP-heptose:LPS heptosyltransferase